MTEVSIPEKSLIQLRHQLHKNPELSGKENETAKRIVKFLKSQKPGKIIEGIGGHGIAAIYEFSPSPTILIRCELDALPIKEVNDFKYISATTGVSHKCGHDGHMAIVAGLASYLKKSKLDKGRIVLLFQPAEEDGSGAEKVLKDKKFKEIKPDYAFALHNLPGFELNRVVCRPGIFSASVLSLIIKLDGKISHAAQPEKGINPSLAIADIINKTHQMEKPASSKDFALVTPIQIEMGEERFGTSAGHGTLKLTLRTWDKKHMQRLVSRVEKVIKSTAKKYKLKTSVEWTQPFRSNLNGEDMTAIIKKAATINKLKYTNKNSPFRWGEDFGLFTEKFKGAMFGIGSGKDSPALHNNDYDFPDEIITSGVKMFASIIDQILHE